MDNILKMTLRIKPISRILLSHPTGNANVRTLAEALARAGLLRRFYTCIALFQNSPSYKFSKRGALKEFHRRLFSLELKSYTHTRPYRELGRMAAQKLGWQAALVHEKGVFCVDNVYRDLDSHVSKNLQDNSAIYAYEDGALESFTKAKSQAMLCLYDLPTGYWRANGEFLETERAKRPEWAHTLKCFHDSATKLARKDKEIELADAIFVASKFTKNTLELYPGALPPIYLVPYGFPEVYKNRSYEPLRDRKLKILFVGGLSQLKGLANLLEAADQLEGAIELTIVGRKVVEGCIPLEVGLAKHTWIPSLPHQEVLRLMRSQDVFVFPSLFEGYGLVITEAMSQGTPVITTKRTCGADFIEDGKNGWLVAPGDTQGIVEKLEYIIAHPESIPPIGRAASATAKELPMSIYGEKMVEAIEKIINSN